jgi:DNA processing protein
VSVALRHWLQLSLTDGIGPILGRRLVETAGGIEAACAADAKLLRAVEGIGTAKSSQILRSLREAESAAEAEMKRAAEAGARIICSDDRNILILLKSIPDPPLVLYVKGTIEPRDLNGVAIVGSRRCSYYGREQSERFAALLAGAGFTVISGGARGVDSAAHRGAMSHLQGRTIAVLGCGINIAYPPENAALFEQIAARGAVLSEYPIDAPPAAENFHAAIESSAECRAACWSSKATSAAAHSSQPAKPATITAGPSSRFRVESTTKCRSAHIC